MNCFDTVSVAWHKGCDKGNRRRDAYCVGTGMVLEVRCLPVLWVGWSDPAGIPDRSFLEVATKRDQAGIIGDTSGQCLPLR